MSLRFGGMFAPALASFEVRFGPMTGYSPVYLVHSLSELDGGTRDLPQGSRLLFGADVIARIHARHDIQPFFHHELFHLHRARALPACAEVWCNLWTEGLAVYVSAELNPGAKDDELELSLPEPIRPEVEKDRAAAVCPVTARLNSSDPKDYNTLFSFGRLSPTLRPRFGHYMGYLVAEELGKTRSLDQLARRSHAQARPLIDGALKTFRTCEGRIG